jgi:hypothetical protein
LQEVTIGTANSFELSDVKSQYVIDSLKVFFSDNLASQYAPILYGSEDEPNMQPEGIYYRIVCNPHSNEYCMQYYVYWLNQDCSGFIGVSNHIYDYEPIFVFITPPDPNPVGIVNSGWSKIFELNHCRFHKTEVRRKEYSSRDPQEFPQSFKTSQSPFYPFGGASGINGTNCVKRYPISSAIYFEQYRPLFGIATCFHAFSGAADALTGNRIKVPLKRLDDTILGEWFLNHYKTPKEEPFGHDVSNPFDFPYIKYIDPKPYL